MTGAVVSGRTTGARSHELGTRVAWIAIGISVVLWATAFPAIRAAVKSYEPTTLTAFRLLVASLALGLAALWRRPPMPRRSDVPRLVLCGVLGMAGYQLLLNLGEETVPAGTASMIVATAPAYSVLLAAATLGERLSWRGVAGIGIALGGAALIALGDGGELRLETGVLLIVGAALAHGSYHVAHRPLLADYSGTTVVSYATWLATLLILPLVGAIPGEVAGAQAEATAAVVFLGLGPSAVAFATWAYGVHRLGVGPAATSLYLGPVVALPVAALWLGERPHAVELVGGAVALCGVVVANRRRPEHPAVGAGTASDGGEVRALAPRVGR